MPEKQCTQCRLRILVPYLRVLMSMEVTVSMKKKAKDYDYDECVKYCIKEAANRKVAEDKAKK